MDGVLEVVPGAGDILSTASFADFQLHLEFCLPHMPEKVGQDRANSGVYLQGRFEIQLLDTAGRQPTDDTAGAIYKRATPLQDPILPAEAWQSLEVAFRAERPGVKPAITAFLNGILIHHACELDLPTPGGLESLGGEGPLLLQDHGAPVRFRNIWILPVGGRP